MSLELGSPSWDFPAIGSAAGAAILATVATIITTTFGECHVVFLYALLKDDPDKKTDKRRCRQNFLEKL